jgi:hypothetical protein
MFWEDVWFGHCSLATVFWDLYVIDNEQHCTIESVLDGVDLKITFRGVVSPDLYNRWLNLVNLVASVSFFEDGDALVWMFHLSGIYSVKYLYAIVNNGGVVPVHKPSVWRLVVRPRIHIFLWFLANNNTLTRDNLNKRFHVEDRTCLFCSELESVDHLFFKCVVAKQSLPCSMFLWVQILNPLPVGGLAIIEILCSILSMLLFCGLSGP